MRAQIDGAPKMSDEMTLEEVVNETIVILKTEGRMPWRAQLSICQLLNRRAFCRFLASERKNRALALNAQADIEFEQRL